MAWNAGPLSVLRQCFQEKHRVRVVTRHRKGVRGICWGFLVAFDKYMNMVLKDVDEEYTTLIKILRHTGKLMMENVEGVENDGDEGRSSTRGRMRLCRKQDHRKRHIAQLLLRGDSVVMISRAE